MVRTRYLALTCACLGLLAAILVYRGPGWRLVRGSVGDAVAVAFLVFALGAALGHRMRLGARLSVAGITAVALELAQLLPLPWRESGILAVVVGAHFDPTDFAWYSMGLLCAALSCIRVERALPTIR